MTIWKKPQYSYLFPELLLWAWWEKVANNTFCVFIALKRVWEREREREKECVWKITWECVCVCVKDRVCVCVCERERERERERVCVKDRVRESVCGREREKECVWKIEWERVCVWERQRQREKECVWKIEWERGVSCDWTQKHSLSNISKGVINLLASVFQFLFFSFFPSFLAPSFPFNHVYQIFG